MITRGQWKRICEDTISLLGNNYVTVELNNGTFNVILVDIIKNTIRLRDDKNRVDIVLKHPISMKEYSEYSIRDRIKYIPILEKGDLNIFKRNKR